MDYLQLADWRRRVAHLYAEVRRIALTDPAAALAQWRAVRARLYREHPQSPVPPAQRPAFRARHFPHDPALRFEAHVLPDAPAPSRTAAAGAHEGAVPRDGPAPVPMSGGAPLALRRLGWVDLPFPAGTRRLAVYWIDDYGGGLFLPVRDATNGRETYGAGRYVLDGAKGADLGGDMGRGTLIVDFNFAYHPSCAFDPRWSCPLAPPENRLDLPIRAGERLV